MDGNGMGPNRAFQGSMENGAALENELFNGAGQENISIDNGEAAEGGREQQETQAGPENGTGAGEEGQNRENQSRLERCRERILSNEYADSIIRMAPMLQSERELFSAYCMEAVDDNFSIIHIGRANIPPLLYENYNYDAFPNLFGLMDKESLDASGILSMQNQPNLNLRGRGVIIGFIDTGIDYASVKPAQGKECFLFLRFLEEYAKITLNIKVI